MISRDAPLNAAHAQRLLSDPTTTEGALARLLSDAIAPARADELTGEDEAVRAFHLARRSYVAPPLPVHHRRRRPRWAWALVLKVAAVLLATAGAGWALAASTGVLPAPWEEPAPVSPPATRSVPAGLSSTMTPGPGATVSPTPSTSGVPTPSTVGSPSAQPSMDAAIHGLCQAFVAQGEDPDLLSSPSFVRLVEAAGTADQVPALCESLLGLAPSPSLSPSQS